MAGHLNCGQLSTRDVLISFVAARLRVDGYVDVPALEQQAVRVNISVTPVTSRLMDYDRIMAGSADANTFMHNSARDIIALGQPGMHQNVDRIREAVTSTLDGMFGDGNFHWGRINTAVIFTYMLCAAAMRQNSPNLVLTIINTVDCYFQRNNLDGWIINRGGWEVMPGQMGGGQVQRQAQGPEASIRAAITGTVLIGSILASVWNIMRQ